MMMRTYLLILPTLLLLAGAAFGQAPKAADWSYWRGPNYNGTSSATGLPATWDPDGGEGSNLKWHRDDLAGRSTPVAMDGKLYLITRADPGTEIEGERVVCIDAATGETVWEHKFNVWMSDVPDTRVGWASVVADPETGNVYALGVCDIFMCLDGKTGEEKWSVPLHEFLGMLSTYGGRTNFPIIHEDLVIISGIIINWGDAAKPNHRFLAMDKRTGEIVWFSPTRDLPDDTSYSAPSLAVINGQLQMVVGGGDGAVWGFQPRTGKTLWNYQFSRRGLFATPLVVGNRVYAGHGEENMEGTSMGALAAIEIEGTGSDTKAKELWKMEGLILNRSSPLVIGDRLYIVDDRCKLWVVDAKTGEMIQERVALGDRKQWASLVYADGRIYAVTENGRWAFMELSDAGVDITDKGRISNEAFYASPIVYDGAIYFVGTSGIYCIADEKAKPGVTPAPEAAKEMANDDKTPAWVQVVPAEAIVRPGEKIDYKVSLFNQNGQFIEEASDPKLTVVGGGSVDGTTFDAADQNGSHYAATVTATVGDLQGSSRVRVVPALPWKFTFDELDDAPVTWVGARYRHVIREVDGSPALVKVSTIPKGARSRGWMGHWDLANYTISADVKGQQVGTQLPDIGLTAMGYALDLQGNSQKLQIRTWYAQLRMAKTVPFEWKADVWYRMKLQAGIEEQDGKKVAVLKGKVWPRDDKEPSEWTVTAVDHSPNLSGSPGLYGNAKVCELYLDNIEVTANEQ
ncbi:PQQ-binding-like beta-propeller repeat protein [Rosistilla oblonga]|uniref:PQQ-binding-like beta-propeller repeat protein n=1 Tax=Rosistilla oblonga TaxID=2527990 RepID=UPI003A9770E3